MDRYSGKHAVLRAGAFVVPFMPLMCFAALYPDTEYVANAFEFCVLWFLGLAISCALIAVHELGHALVAWAFGIPVQRITVGHWKRLLSFKIKATAVDLRAAPDSGYVNLDYTAESWRLLPLTAVLLAGISAEALVLFWTALVSGPSGIDSFSALVVGYTRVALFWMGGWHIVFSLFPHEWCSGAVTHVSDGMQIVRIWRARKQMPEQRAFLAEAREIHSLRQSGQATEAREKAKALAARCPDDVRLQVYLASLCADAGDAHEAEAMLRRALDKSGADCALRAQVLDGLACLALYGDRPDLLREAEAWVGEAISASPHAITLKGTRGSILVELGRIDEAIPVLEKVIARSEESTDHGISAAYLAKAHLIQGNKQQALAWLAKARLFLPDHVVVKRISEQVTAASENAPSSA